VRLNSTFRSLGILFGPVIGGVLLLGLGAEAGIFVNAAFYAPLVLFLLRTRATGHSRDLPGGAVRFGFRELGRISLFVVRDRTLTSMIVLAGLGSFFVGASLQSVMPAFAGRLGAGTGDAAYSALLFATGAGGVLGGLLLEATGWPKPTIRSAVIATLVYGAGILGFAMTRSFPLALALLFVAGVANLASTSISQTVVQLLAPPAERGRVVGLYGVAANGLRLGSGFTVGLFGAAVGVGAALTWSAAALCVGTVVTGAIAARGRRRRAEPRPA
jgi:MFS family permease